MPVKLFFNIGLLSDFRIFCDTGVFFLICFYRFLKVF